MTGRDCEGVVLEGVIFVGILLLRAEVLDDVIPGVLGLIGRVPVILVA